MHPEHSRKIGGIHVTLIECVPENLQRSEVGVFNSFIIRNEIAKEIEIIGLIRIHLSLKSSEGFRDFDSILICDLVVDRSGNQKRGQSRVIARHGSKGRLLLRFWLRFHSSRFKVRFRRMIKPAWMQVRNR